MKKFVMVLLTIFETIIYTFGMVMVSNLKVTNNTLIFIINCVSLVFLSILIYIVYRFILNKIEVPLKPNLYYICLFNFLVGIVLPVFLIILIPNEKLNIFVTMILIATFSYGFIINILISLINHIFTKN